MAIVDGKPLEAIPSDLPPKLIVKLREGATTELSSDAQRLLANHGVKSKSRPLLDEEDQLSPSARRVLAPYITFELPRGFEADAILEQLNNLPEVEDAYIGGQPCPPPVQPADDPRSSDQGYLNAAPDGIDARWAWAETDGSGVGFVDLEHGWTLDHEDLISAGITIISGINHDSHGHGTAVLGEIVASDNAIGCIGIAPMATARVVSAWRRTSSRGNAPTATSSRYDVAAAILSAADNMSYGDVLLLEVQTEFVPSSKVYFPVEIHAATFDAIRYAVDQGIVVVEAAGNGDNNLGGSAGSKGNDLDAFANGKGKQVLNKSSTDFTDSGAIMVGAASSTNPHSRLSASNWGSNYGNRIDCFGWGELVATCDGGASGKERNSYTRLFGGTSSASPMIAGAALLLQSWFAKVDGQRASPAAMRSILRGQANTSSADPPNDRIGVMPNLRAIIEFQQAIRLARPHQYASLIYILVGLIDDLPGFIWVPGKGPVPVDPGWGKSPLSSAQKDLLVGLAVSELSTKIADTTARQGMVTQAIKAMQRSVAAIGRQLRS